MDGLAFDVVALDGPASTLADLPSGLAPGPLIAIALLLLGAVALADLVLPRSGVGR